jgi:large subunit ribosomal protein L23
MHYVIKRPLVTEKNSVLAEKGVYVFEVDAKATKTEIKAAVEKFFRVKVSGVNTAICRGHAKRTKFGISKPITWKKALVRLKAGEKIGLFEGA